MKTYFKLLILILFIVPMAVSAQKGGPPKKEGAQSGGSQNAGGDCFKEWYSIMRERGAAAVTDGTHDVIITLRNTQEGSSKCYMGRVEVAGGIMTRRVLVQKEDGSYEPFASLGIGLEPAFAKSMTENEMNTITGRPRSGKASPERNRGHSSGRNHEKVLAAEP